MYLVMNRLPNYLVLSYLCSIFVVLMKGIEITMHSQIKNVSLKTRRYRRLAVDRLVKKKKPNISLFMTMNRLANYLVLSYLCHTFVK